MFTLRGEHICKDQSIKCQHTQLASFPGILHLQYLIAYSMQSAGRRLGESAAQTTLRCHTPIPQPSHVWDCSWILCYKLNIETFGNPLKLPGYALYVCCAALFWSFFRENMTQSSHWVYWVVLLVSQQPISRYTSNLRVPWNSPFRVHIEQEIITRIWNLWVHIIQTKQTF